MSKAAKENQLKIPGSATKQEEALEQELDGELECTDQIASLKEAKNEHRENALELMKALGRKKHVYRGYTWDREKVEKLKKNKIAKAEKTDGGEEVSEESDGEEKKGKGRAKIHQIDSAATGGSEASPAAM